MNNVSCIDQKLQTILNFADVCTDKLADLKRHAFNHFILGHKNQSEM